MSDDTAADQAAPAEAEVPAAAGEAEAEATASDQPSYLDLDQYGTHVVRVKIDGEEQEVPLSEALGGYQRQADYTRKTQALAEQQRQAEYALTLQRALENNPQATLRILQEQFQQPQPAPDEYDETDPYADRWKDYDERIARYEAFQARQELDQAIRTLRTRYGDEFDPKAVVSRAHEQGRMDLENVYKEMAFERYWVAQQAQQETAKRQADEDTARNAAKAQAAQLHSGNGANPSAAEQPAGSVSSVADAWAQAKRQLGL